MILGIDASNIRSGGGLTHLLEVLRSADPEKYSFSKVILFGNSTALNSIENRSWLIKSHHAMLDKSIIHRYFWQRFKLSKNARNYGCDILFIPGGSFHGKFPKVVAMCQNMLPFEWNELRRFGLSLTTCRYLLLNIKQRNTFRKSNGIVFLTRYAMKNVLEKIKTFKGKTIIIPHGINKRFYKLPSVQNSIQDYSFKYPYHILYVSIINQYKHQWNVVRAISKLKKNNLPVVLDLVGPAYSKALVRLNRSIMECDPEKKFIYYHGVKPYNELFNFYRKANLFVFASSCENLPNILIEGMASGLPIACSNRGPMPDILGTAGIYFDPEDPDDIASAIMQLIKNPELRFKLAQKSFKLAEKYSWNHCADETFSFLSEIAKN